MGLLRDLLAASPDSKADLTPGHLIEHLEVGDLCARGADPAEHRHLVDRVGSALQHRSDHPVDQVAHPSVDASRLGHPADGLTKEHPLDQTVYHDALADQVAHRRPSMPWTVRVGNAYPAVTATDSTWVSDAAPTASTTSRTPAVVTSKVAMPSTVCTGTAS